MTKLIRKWNNIHEYEIMKWIGKCESKKNPRIISGNGGVTWIRLVIPLIDSNYKLYENIKTNKKQIFEDIMESDQK